VNDHGPDNHDSWVQAAPFRALLARLMDVTGLAWPVLADHGRLPPRLVEHLLYGRDGRRLARIPRECACRILALDERRLLQLARQQGVFA
jgi:hypothetical protein